MAKVDVKHKGPSFWERLQPRERVLVMALVGVFLLMAMGVMMFLRHKKLSDIDDEIADKRAGLDLARTFGPSYQEKLARKAEAAQKISATPLLFSTLVEEAQTVAEVTASNQAEKPAVEVAPGLQMRTYEFDLRGVTLAQLTKFLSTVESKEGHVVLTQGLTIRSPSGSEDRLNVDVVLATWERVTPEDEQQQEQEG
jgi:type II secretory pathway component PulM